MYIEQGGPDILTVDMITRFRRNRGRTDYKIFLRIIQLKNVIL